jgi:hypothetical protein
MSDSTNEIKRTPWWNKLLYIAVGLIAASIAKVTVEAAFKQFNKPSKAQIEKSFDDYASNSEGGALLRELRQLFPDDYAAMRSRLATLSASGTKSAEARSKAAEETRAFLRQNLHHTIKAPREYLIAIGQANADFMTSVKMDSLEACAEYGTKGAIDSQKLSSRSMNLLSLLGAAQVRAAYEGMRSPVQHEEEFSDADSETFYASLKQQNISDNTLAALSSEKGLEQLPIDEQCSVGSAMLNGVPNLPSDVAVKLVISLLKN